LPAFRRERKRHASLPGSPAPCSGESGSQRRVIVALLARDLIIASRIAEAAARSGVEFRRIDNPSDLPPASEINLLFVDWGNRGPDWGEQLAEWKSGVATHGPPRVILFGPHV